MEAAESWPIIKTFHKVAVLSMDVPEEAFQVYRRIKAVQPILYPSETMAYWMSLSAKGLRRLFSCLSSCSLSTLEELVKEAEEYIKFCISMDDVIKNQLVDLDYLQLSFSLNRLETYLAGHGVLPANFDFKHESLHAWRDIQEIIQYPSFPFKVHVKLSIMESNCNSPKSILGANNIISFSDSDSSKEHDMEETNNSEGFLEQDIARLTQLVSFALDSPQVSVNPFSSLDDLEIAKDSNPTMNGTRKNPTQYHSVFTHPTQTPSSPTFQTPCKCLYQSPTYPSLPSPCLLFAACEKHPGHNHVNCNPQVPATTPIPQINMSPPIYPSFNNNSNFGGAFYNTGSSPTSWDPFYYKPPPPPHVAPMPTKQKNFNFNPVIPIQSTPLPTVPPRISFFHYNFSHGFYNKCPNGEMLSFPMMNNHNHNPIPYPNSYNDHEYGEKINSRRSVEIFENEIKELLKGRRKPLRISMLPSMYEERFHRPFNRSHEKLTALLSKCRNILLVYRPEGQHVIMLKHNESIASTRDSKHGRGRSNQSLDPKNRKIYLTFPPGSTFTSNDAEDYFRQFGPVRGIRMSHEEPPTYAFVEFYTSEGALSALCSTRAHYIAGQKVMVKPYKQPASHKQYIF